ncbi:glutamate--cysteine ligase [Herbiconiux sp. L3-i23]|uniref:glutamate--cysteine ligase n=1 Tax=Herbiconiux sp. L3-i23 TaxID=2905871 RepID=UPI00206F754B|nr:glutamate--cysteine ligase [Herbiconiux sp. L3-i23]BDI21901.1 putative glutamate--cysteine ligase 2 [Herbiconiux sp. L3-i23]
MAIEFGTSQRSTLGLEWELALVDRASGDLSPTAPEILEHFEHAEEDGIAQVTGELLTNTVEVVTGVHRTVRGASEELAATIERIRDLAEPLGADLMCAGTHPFAQWTQQRVTDKERYATLIDRTQWWGRQMLIWGVHMHVGIEDRDKVLPILNGLLTYYPHFQALSASSPYWSGEPTGYASSRAMLFQQLPTAGLPPQFGAWANYEGLVDDLLHVGVIDHYDEIRWDIRPSPKWGTIEIRACDGLSTLQEVRALAALVQCLVEEFSTMLDRGEDIPTMQPWFVRENKWRAARYGMETILIQNAAGDERLVREDTAELITRLEPVAERLGCLEELHELDVILDRGASYERQLRTAARNGGSLKSVVAHLVAELRDGIDPPL